MMLSKVGKIEEPLIHHSDRGTQYTSHEYLALLNKNGIIVSMGGSAQENAYAERINGIIKNEYLNYRNIESYRQLVNQVKKSVVHYNTNRKHQAFNNRFTPLEFKKKVLDLDAKRRPMVIIYAAENFKIKKASSLLDFSQKERPQALNCPLRLNEC
nr:integrase core domain-containing protein [Flammeovirga aprica]